MFALGPLGVGLGELGVDVVRADVVGVGVLVVGAFGAGVLEGDVPEAGALEAGASEAGALEAGASEAGVLEGDVLGVSVLGAGVLGVGVFIDGLGSGALGLAVDENVCGGSGTLGAGNGGGVVVEADPGAAAKPSVVDCGSTAVEGGGSATGPGAMGGWSMAAVLGATDPSTGGRGSVACGATPEVSCPRSPTAIPPVVTATRTAPVPISIDDFPNRDLDRCRPTIAAPFCVVQNTRAGSQAVGCPPSRPLPRPASPLACTLRRVTTEPVSRFPICLYAEGGRNTTNGESRCH